MVRMMGTPEAEAEKRTASIMTASEELLENYTHEKHARTCSGTIIAEARSRMQLPSSGGCAAALITFDLI